MSDAPDELSVLAGEYVLGVLDEAETSSVRRRAEVDPQLARAILAWENRLSPLVALVPPVAPPPLLWMRIDQSVGPAAPPAPTGFRREQPRERTRGGAGLWPAATAVALGLAAVFAAIAYLPRAAPPVRFAALAPTSAPAAFLAEARQDGTVLLTALSPAPVPDGRDLELWLLPKGASAVTSLGVLPAGGRRMRLDGLAEGSQLLVSLEPRGGSTTGKPTGPVLYGGTLITR